MVQSKAVPEVPRIPVGEARRRHDRGEAILVDVRDKAAYDQAHVRGAIHMPVRDFPRRYQELPQDRDIIAY